jgi:hypothetical protein
MMLSKMYDDDHCIKLHLCIFEECIRLLCIRLFGYLEQNLMVIRPFVVVILASLDFLIIFVILGNIGAT